MKKTAARTKRVKKRPLQAKMISDQGSRYCIVIVGPTGVGKTAMAVTLARRWGTEVLSADSRQCYREMDIGVARPTPAEIQGVPHHFIASHSIRHQVHAAEFERFALQVAEQVFQHHPILVVAGGTGLYLKAFLEGIDVMPEIPDDIRSRVRYVYACDGLEGLLAAFPSDDPFLSGGELANPHRVMRALEVRLATGQSIRHLQKGEKATRPFKTLYIGLDLPREELYARINARVLQMMQQGLLDEVKRLLPEKENVCLQTVGYRELFDYLEGKYDLNRAVALIQQHTRHYAKRQLTWFRSLEEISWHRPEDLEGVVEKVRLFTGMEPERN
jgi:tRNA dimethylallyltransferase